MVISFNLHLYLQPFKTIYLIPVETKYWSVKKVTIKEKVYQINSVIALSVNAENIPSFFKLSYILIVDEEDIDLCERIIRCKSFLRNYFAYEVSEEDWILVQTGEELDAMPHHIYEVERKNILYLRYQSNLFQSMSSSYIACCRSTYNISISFNFYYFDTFCY